MDTAGKVKTLQYCSDVIILQYSKWQVSYRIRASHEASTKMDDDHREQNSWPTRYIAVVVRLYEMGAT